MRQTGSPQRAAAPHGGVLPFSGLGIGLESLWRKAARMIRALARPRATALFPPGGPEPPRPWGIALLVTLSRFTRAG